MADAPGVFSSHLTATIRRFAADRQRHKRNALWLKMGASILGAGATILLGWESPGDLAPALKNAALVMTALITVVAAYDAFFEPRKLWVRETFVHNSLRDLEREFQVRLAMGQLAPDEVEHYSARLHEILKKSLSDWVEGKAAGS